MCSAWAQPQRGTLPVAWAIDPLLAERFPALFQAAAVEWLYDWPSQAMISELLAERFGVSKEGTDR